MFRADRTPAAGGLADEHRAGLPERHAEDAALEALAEGVGRALPGALHLLHGDAHEFALALVADEELAGERAGFSAGAVFDHVGVGDTEDGVGQPNSARAETGEVFGDDVHGFFEIEDLLGAEFHGRSGGLAPRETGGMADKFAGLEMGDFSGADPLAPVVGGEPRVLRADG